jgi:ABC-type multidrug transport system fused ATPase/permease subunit
MTKIEFPRRPVAFLVYFLKSLSAWQKTAISSMLFITMAITVSHTFMMYAFKLLVDAIPSADPQNVWDTLRWPFILVIGNCIFHTVMYRVRDFIDLKSTPYVQNSLREMLMNNVIRHSHDYFHNRFSGELVNKVGNICATYRNILWDRLMHGLIPRATNPG